jgi:hypothetical protein
VIEGQPNLTKYITEFYKTIFGKSEISQISLDPEGVDKISNDDQKSLLEQFSLEEIKEAVFGMEPNKAAGPDGFNAEFYQKKGAG